MSGKSSIEVEVGDAFERRLKSAVAEANIPTLLMVIVQLTGETRWLGERYRPTQVRGLGDNDTGGLSKEVQGEIREEAFRAIRDWKHGAPPALAKPSEEDLVEMLSVAMGEPVPIGYADMIIHELGSDAGRADQSLPHAKLAVPEGFHAVIIGAGASGLCAAVNFRRAGIPFTIIERNHEVGGVWYENHYPGAGVDTPSHLYCYSFAKNDWTRYFASQAELRQYFNRIADDFGLRKYIRFGVEVERAEFGDTDARWTLRLRREDGTEETLETSLLISAVGAFNKPKWPDLPGLDRFAGEVVHTARWDDNLELKGKRVAVLGNGASSMQLVPAVADEVKSLTVFQRSPQWAAPFEQFKKPIPEGVRWLFRNVPLYEKWYRIRLAWTFNDRIYDSLQKDPEWGHPDRSINAINDAHRRYFTRHIESEIAAKPELLEKVLPTYPPFGKRMLLDNGWFRTMTRDHVTLVTDSIARVTESGVETEAGESFDVDVLVIATGFDVVRFLAPMQVTGRGGVSLDDVWQGDDARAYLGTAVPGFPNFFCLYGPNTQFGHGGSLIFMLELQMHYLMDLFRQAFEKGVTTIECRQDIHDAYNARIDEAHANMVWTHPGMDVYYRNSKGRVVVNNPFKIVDYWHFVRCADLDHYILGKAGARLADEEMPADGARG